MQTLGIDVGGNSVKITVFEGGKAIHSAQSAPYVRPTTDQLLHAITEATRDIPGDYVATGVCVPGLMDRTSRTVTLSVNVPGLVGIPLDELLMRAMGRSSGTLTIVNDARAAGVDVVVTHGLTGRVLVLALGTGVGAAVLDDGRELAVDGDSPGHIGQIDVSLSDDAPVGPDGGAGSLEAYIGTAALIRQYGSMDRFFETVKVEEDPILALVRAIRICHAIYRPNHVVLAGGVGIRLKHLIDDLKSRVDRNLTSVARMGWTLRSGKHDFHASHGAARIAAEAIRKG